jgi:hypothetical protein
LISGAASSALRAKNVPKKTAAGQDKDIYSHLGNLWGVQLLMQAEPDHRPHPLPCFTSTFEEGIFWRCAATFETRKELTDMGIF